MATSLPSLLPVSQALLGLPYSWPDSRMASEVVGELLTCSCVVGYWPTYRKASNLLSWSLSLLLVDGWPAILVLVLLIPKQSG